MEKDIVDIITEKQFIELSLKEKAELSEFCSNEDEYNHLRDVMLGVGSITFDKVAPRKETKQKLDDLFDQTYPKVAPVWYMSVVAVVVPKDKAFIHQPMLKVAALVLLIFLVYPIFNQDVVVDEVQVSEVKNQIDEADKSIQTVRSEDDNFQDELVKSSDEEAVLWTPLSDDDYDLEGGSNTRGFSSDADVMLSDAPVTALSQPAGLTGAFSTTGAIAPGANHPDGVFMGNGDTRNAVASTSAAQTPDVFDLLTATF